MPLPLHLVLVGRQTNTPPPSHLPTRSVADDEAAEPPRLPVVVLMPDGQSLCTAREDAAWAAAVAAADGSDQAEKQGGQAAAAAAAAATTPNRRWWEHLPVGFASPGRRQAQQRQEGQPHAAPTAAEAASNVELASAAPRPAYPSRASSSSAAGEQGAGEGSSHGGSRHGASSRASSLSQQQHGAAAPQQQGATQLRPLHVSSRRRSRSATGDADAAAAAATLQRMVRASTGQQLAMRQAGMAPLSPRASLSPRPRRPVPIFDIEVALGTASGGDDGAGGMAVRPDSAASASSGPGTGSGASGADPARLHSSLA